jgi:O-antigen/teichoic acid export membrane protein
MIHEDWLQTLAEIAVTLAGFSGLLSGIRQRTERESRVNSTRLRTIVETSFSVLAFCLIPVFLAGLGLAENAAYRIAALAFLVGFVPSTLRGFRRFLQASGAEHVAMTKGLTRLTVAVSATALLSGVACVVGLPSDRVPTFYLISLTGTLSIGAINFLGFAIGLAQLETLEESPPD